MHKTHATYGWQKYELKVFVALYGVGYCNIACKFG